MQLYALSVEQETIFALNGKRGKDYFCRECGSKVRVRFGEKRRAHFFHLSANRTCRENKKSEEHIETQYFLYRWFAERGIEAELEKKFSFGRIADLYIPQENIVFEVQCSLFSLEEGRKRTEDYLREGFKIIWILHLKSFRQKKATAFEAYLSSFPHYFTDINKEGLGQIFDEFTYIEKGRRYFFSPSLPLDNFSLYLPSLFEEESPSFILSLRQKRWPYAILNDFLYKEREGVSFEEEKNKEKLFFPLREKDIFKNIAERIKKKSLTLYMYVKDFLIESLI